MNECEMISSATTVNSTSTTSLTPNQQPPSQHPTSIDNNKSIEISDLNKTQEKLNNKTDTTNNFFIKNPRKSDYNLNILDSELVTFRKNFYHHLPKRRIPQNTKTMEKSSYQSATQLSQQGQQNPTKIINTNSYIQKTMTTSSSSSPAAPTTISTLQSHQLQQNILSNLSSNANEMQTSTSNNKLRDKESERVVWEMWMRTPNTTPASTVLNSPDLTEIESSKNYQNQSHQIKVGRSPVSGHTTDNGSPTAAQPQQNVAVVADGEIVVFDDIEDNWQRQQNNILASPASITDTKFDDFDLTNYRYTTDNSMEIMNTSSKITKMIGGLPINDYEGSPRRFGSNLIHHDDGNELLHQQSQKLSGPCNLMPSPSLFPPRPGFPQRIVPMPSSQSAHQPSTMNSLEMQNDDLCIKTSTINTGTDSIDPMQHKQGSSGPLENKPKESTFDYLYEFSETRKVLEEFFKCPNDEKKLSDFNESDGGSFLDLNQMDNNPTDNMYIGQRLAKIPKEEFSTLESPRPSGLYNNIQNENYDNNEIELYLDSGSRSSGELADTELEHNNRRHSRNFTLSPETTDYDSNCGDLDSLSNDINGGMQDFVRLYTSMPVLEDGLSSGHASDTENNNPISISVERKIYELNQPTINNKMIVNPNKLDSPIKPIPGMAQRNDNYMLKTSNTANTTIDTSYTSSIDNNSIETCKIVNTKSENDCESIYSINNLAQTTPPPPAPVPHRIMNQSNNQDSTSDVQAALRDIKTTLQRTQKIPSANDKLITNMHDTLETSNSTSPIWIPRNETSNSHESLDESIDNQSKLISCDEEEADTDLETDRLLGQQRLDDQGFYDDKMWCEQSSRKINNLRHIKSPTSSKSTLQNQINFSNTTTIRSGVGCSSGGGVLGNGSNVTHDIVATATTTMVTSPTTTSTVATPAAAAAAAASAAATTTTTNEGNEIINDDLQTSPTESTKLKKDKNGKTRSKEGFHDPAVLIEGVLFRARYLGSTQLVCEGQPTKTTRMMQAEEAVSRIKAPEGESQPSTEVDLFISTEKIMVLNTDLKEIMMDHALRTISYIADIGDLVVLMARRRFVPSELDDAPKPNRTPKMICHVFESEEAQFIAQSIGQAFQVAYMEFLKANGIEDHSFVKEMDYQEVLNSQEIFGDELEIFAKKELQKEVVVPKAKGEILGVVIVESGWGSMLPTVVIANLLSTGAAARCGQLNIGDQIIAINGLSLVGLPLSTCQNYIRNTKNQTAVKFTVVPCPPVVEVKIKRPNTKYQLGFSVQNGVICSLLRGGIAERGGVRVGHRIIEINNQSVVAVPHEKIVNLLATSVGEILMKTMPTSMFRLLTGQENPIYI